MAEFKMAEWEVIHGQLKRVNKGGANTAELYEKYKVWLPWRWIPIGIYLAIVYCVGGIFYVSRGLKGLQERWTAEKPAMTLPPAAEVPVIMEQETKVGKVQLLKVKVFAKRIATEGEELTELVREKEEATTGQKEL